MKHSPNYRKKYPRHHKHSRRFTYICLGLVVLIAVSTTLLNIHTRHMGLNTLFTTHRTTGDTTVALDLPSESPTVPVSHKLSDKDLLDYSPPPPEPLSPEYTAFWKTMEVQAKKHNIEKQKFTKTFITDFGLWLDSESNIIFTASDAQTPVSVDTLTCLLNGYIPDKPYIKPSCPAY